MVYLLFTKSTYDKNTLGQKLLKNFLPILVMYVIIIRLGQIIEILKHLGKNKTSHNSILPHSAGKSVSLTVICFTLLLFQYDLMAPLESISFIDHSETKKNINKK